MQSSIPTLIFFWDYDTQWGADRPLKSAIANHWGNLEFENTERLLEIHSQFLIPACFAIVGAAALPGSRPYHDPNQIRKIYSLGNEIASHTFHHDWIPGLSIKKLENTLRMSKDALEQCISAPVITFVPPYNQPFDYLQKGSISLSERREAGKNHIGIMSLCQTLSKTGYLVSRISYKSFLQRSINLFFGSNLGNITNGVEKIANINCIRLNIPGGFSTTSLNMLDLCVKKGGIITVYGHPHSLQSGNSQDEKYLIPFMQKAKELNNKGLLKFSLPRDLIKG